MGADLERGVLAEVAVREDEQEFGAVSSLIGCLQRMRHASWEVPQITGTLDTARMSCLCGLSNQNTHKSGQEVLAIRVDGRDLGVALKQGE